MNRITDKERFDWLEEQDGGALINDDMGHWAFASDGFQNLPEDDGPFDLQSTWLVEKHAFANSVREAIDLAMNRSDE